MPRSGRVKFDPFRSSGTLPDHRPTFGTRDRRPWTFVDGAMAVGLVALAVFATLEIWRGIFGYAYHSDEQSHIYLTPIIGGASSTTRSYCCPTADSSARISSLSTRP